MEHLLRPNSGKHLHILPLPAIAYKQPFKQNKDIRATHLSFREIVNQNTSLTRNNLYDLAKGLIRESEAHLGETENQRIIYKSRHNSHYQSTDRRNESNNHHFMSNYSHNNSVRQFEGESSENSNIFVSIPLVLTTKPMNALNQRPIKTGDKSVTVYPGIDAKRTDGDQTVTTSESGKRKRIIRKAMTPILNCQNIAPQAPKDPSMSKYSIGKTVNFTTKNRSVLYNRRLSRNSAYQQLKDSRIQGWETQNQQEGSSEHDQEDFEKCLRLF